MWADFTQSYDTSAALWSDWSAALPDGLQAVVTEHGNDGTVKYGVNEVVVSADGDIKVKFQYGGGQPHKIVILGVELLAGESVVKSDYHVGESGGNNKNNTYTLSGATAGEYTIRYFVCNKPGDHALNSTAGTITFSGNITEKTFEVEPISTEYCYQLKNVAYSTILASDGSYVTVSPKADASDYSQYWAFEEGTDGTYTLRNLAKNKYLVHNSKSNTAWTVGDKGTEFTVGVQSPATANQSARYYVSYDPSNTYACMHDANWGSGYSYRQLVGWEAGAAASQWILTKTDISVKTQPLSVVYSFTYGGVEKYKQTEVALVGDNYPGLSIVLPFGVSAEMPTGIIAAEDVKEGIVNKEIVLSVNLPFNYADSYEAAEKDWNWYYLQFHANSKNYLYYDASKTYLDASKTTIDEENEDAYTWAFVGNPFDGFKVVNRLAGKEMQLNASADGAVLGSAGHVFVLTSSSFAENGFFMASINGDKKDRFNKQNDKVVYWSGADTGSTFMIERRPTDAERLAVAVEKAQALLDANANNHAVAPALRQYSTAGYEAFAAAIQDKNATSKSVETAILEFEKSKNLPLFTIDSQKDYALGQSIYENEEGALKFKATDAIDKTMLWAFDMAATEVGVTDKVVVRNAATGKLFWGASFISVIETEPAVEDDGVFMFKTEGTGNPIHAQASGSSIVRWSSADANAVGGASTWKFAFVGVSNPAAYDLSEVAEQFKAQAAAFGALQENAALSALPAVQEKWVEAMGVVEPLYTQVSGNELVLKADVVAAMATMKEIQAVVTYYSETFAAAKDEANAAMDELDEESEEYKALLGAINVSTVTTVTELEAKAEIIAEVLEYLASLPEVDPNDYTSHIKNAAVTSAEGWNIGLGKYEGGLMKYTSGKLVDFNQTITLPAGQYKMTAKAAYRYTGGEQSEYEAIQAGTNTHLAKLYAETATYKYEGNVMNRYEGASDTDYAAGSGSVTVNGKFVPNSSSAVLKWFEAGQYVNEIVFNVQADGEVKIGIETKETVPGGEYTNISAWTLTRLGDAEADPKEEEPTPDPEKPEIGDVTSKYLVNADFETPSPQNGGAINTPPGWTMTYDLGGWLDASTRLSENPGNDASQCFNVWAGEFRNADIYQKPVLPAGKYKLTVGFYSDGDAERYAYATVGGNTIKSANAKAGSWDFVSVEFLNTSAGEVTLGAVSKGWFQIDNVTLEYLGEVLKDDFVNAYNQVLSEAKALVDQKMDLSIATQLDAVILANGSLTAESSIEDLDKATNAISAVVVQAKASAATYAANKTAIDGMFALINSTNVYTVEAYEAYKAKAEGFLTQYEAGALNDKVDNPAAIHGWHATADYCEVLLSAFGIAVDDWANLHINTWSTEGETDGSDFKVPFYEYWTGDGESLGVATKTATVAGLTPGKSYEVEAWVRVRAKNGVAATDATGITLSVGEGEATDLTEGEVIGTSQFSHAVFTATGKADETGALKINFNILEGNNVSWLSFKNVKYTEVEVVEPEYLTVVGAKVGDVAIVEGKATVESISSFEITFDRPVVKVEDAEWAQLTDKWGDTSLKAEVLEDNNCVVRFSLQWDVYTDAGDYYLYIPEGVVVAADNADLANAAIEAVITIEGGSVEPATPLAVVNVTVGEDVMAELSAIVATTEDMIKVNFDGKFYFQGEPSIVDAEGNDASSSFEYMNGLDVDGSNSYIFMGKKEGTYTITLAKAQFNELEMMGWKAPAEDIVLTVTISVPDGIQNINVDADAVIYDIHGRRVEKMTKGLYIVNGRKVMVK